MTARVDVELMVKDIDEDDALEIWQRLQLVAQGFLRDGREVSVTTYRFTDHDDIEVLDGPPENGATA